jgi:hypothetical protein
VVRVTPAVAGPDDPFQRQIQRRKLGDETIGSVERVPIAQETENAAAIHQLSTSDDCDEALLPTVRDGRNHGQAQGRPTYRSPMNIAAGLTAQP